MNSGRAPRGALGVSAESLYLSVCAVATDVSLTQALAPHYKTAVLRTNDERAPAQWQTLTAFYRPNSPSSPMTVD
ncbi:hypothetical protein [Halospeciosus flavus]|uniref:hypothetical protein n=1 Tax=Halospeciosus flavus TaxID=3032283 RepID=UPI0036121B4F